MTRYYKTLSLKLFKNPLQKEGQVVERESEERPREDAEAVREEAKQGRGDGREGIEEVGQGMGAGVQRGGVHDAPQAQQRADGVETEDDEIH